MKMHLLSSAAAIAILAGGIAAASAECEIAPANTPEHVASDADTRSGYSAPAMRDIRELRDAAHTLAAYGKDDACEEVVAAINDMVENPEEMTRVDRSGESQAMWSQERPVYTFEDTSPISDVAGQIRAYDLIGSDVRGTDDEAVGEISDIILDTSGTPAYVIVAYGGFLGLGEEESAIPFHMLSVSQDGEVFFVALNSEQIEKAPRFERGSFDWLEDEAWRQENDSYFSETGADRAG